MKKRISLIALFVVVFIVSVVVHLPATVTLNHAPLPRQLKMDGVSGTLWNGRAAQVHWLNYDLGSVSWELHLTALVTGKLEVATRFGRGSSMNVHGRGVVGTSMSGPYAKTLLVSAPAAELVELSRRPVPVGVSGQVELMVRDYQYAQPWCKEAQGTLSWSNSAISSPVGNVQLGPVITDITCKDSVIDAKGKQNNAQVSSEFTATLKPNHQYHTTAWFKPGSEFPNELGKLLSQLPDPDARGRYHFNYDGHF